MNRQPNSALRATPSLAHTTLLCFAVSLLPGCGGLVPDDASPDTPEPVSPTAATPTTLSESPTAPLLTPTPSQAPSPTPGPSPTISDTPLTERPTLTPDLSPSSTPEPTSSPTPEPFSLTCPAEMVAVYEAPEFPLYCMDPFEVTVTGEVGNHNQYNPDAVVPTATAFPLKGVQPSVLLSYDQAVVICQNTAVLATDGVTVLGYKHLATSKEWEDAADGQVGAGGSVYPYGNTYDPTLCATVDANGQQIYPELQPTGSFPDCHSAFQLFDQAGNAWEWADSGLFTDVEGWFALAAVNKLQVDVDPEDFLTGVVQKDASDLEIDMVGVQPISPTLASDGHLTVASSAIQISQMESLKGYLRQRPSYGDPANNLPIQLIPMGDGTVLWTRLLRGEDNRPVPDKRGGAYYVGNSYAYQNSASQRIHFHDFSGTIGFRCAAPPIPR